jgi:hypothetical protein
MFLHHHFTDPAHDGGGRRVLVADSGPGNDWRNPLWQFDGSINRLAATPPR